jgi:hypothetical protein
MESALDPLVDSKIILTGIFWLFGISAVTLTCSAMKPMDWSSAAAIRTSFNLAEPQGEVPRAFPDPGTWILRGMHKAINRKCLLDPRISSFLLVIMDILGYFQLPLFFPFRKQIVLTTNNHSHILPFLCF